MEQNGNLYKQTQNYNFDHALKNTYEVQWRVRERSGMAESAFRQANSGHHLEKRLEGAELGAGRPVMKLLQGFRQGGWWLRWVGALERNKGIQGLLSGGGV